MKQFISCDWGTSSFRLRLIEKDTNNVLAEIKTGQGIAATYALWNGQSSGDRILFYTDVILQQIRCLEEQIGKSLDEVTVIISGMASSSIGIKELPYKSIPFNINNAALQTYRIAATETCKHQMINVSGVRSENDVMRGEETILSGCEIENTDKEQLFIFPGTHSKHVIVQEGMVKDIKTFMTGECFDLLSTKSVLTASVEAEGAVAKNDASFMLGVHESLNSNLLNNIFHVRTNQLFGAFTKKENHHYLSGLLIGEELKDVANKNYASVAIVSSGILLTLYTEALSVLGLRNKIRQVNADEALIKGQSLIFDHYQ